MKGDILYLTFDGLTDPLGQSQILPYIKGLAARGYRFTIISLEKPQRFETDGEWLKQDLLAHAIQWMPLIYTSGLPIISQMQNNLRFKNAVRKALHNNFYSIIHCRSYPSAFIASQLKPLQTRLLLDIRGFWADERIDGHIWNIHNLFYRWVYNYFKRKEQILFAKADHIISLTETGKTILETWKEISPFNASISVIPCCVDTQFFNRSSIEEEVEIAWKKRLQIEPNQLIISYVGSIGTWYMLDEMLLFFKTLLSKYANARFLFITKDNPESIINKAVQMDIAPSHIIIQAGSRADMPYLIYLSQISLFFIRPTFSKIASSPTKQAEIMSMGIPIICNNGIGDTGRIVKNEHAGLLLDSTNTIDIELAVNNFDKLLLISPEKIRTIALTYFSLESGVEKYNMIYNQLTNLK